MNSTRQFIELLFGILIMSTSGVLAKIIHLPAPVTIWLRCLLAAVPFWIALRIIGSRLVILPPNRLPVLMSGVLMGAHWVTYFYALAYSSVAIAMLSLFVYPLFILILEPVFLKTNMEPRHIPLAMLAFVGVYFLVPEFSISNKQTVGLIFGLCSALIYAFRNIIVKRHIGNIPGETLMFYQVLTMCVFLSPVIFLFEVNLVMDVSDNFFGLIMLALLTTVLGHSLFVRSFGYFSATTVSLVSNITPLFGILLAWVFIGEIPTGNVILGGGLILGTILGEGYFFTKK